MKVDWPSKAFDTDIPKVKSRYQCNTNDNLSKDGYNVLSSSKFKWTVFLILQDNLAFIHCCAILTSFLIELFKKYP
jgi:hypothetical protein